MRKTFIVGIFLITLATAAIFLKTLALAVISS